MRLSLSSFVSKASDIFSTSVDDELVIFDQVRGTYYGSGPVGEAIWSLISNEVRISDICDALLQKFEVDRETCEQQVLAFLSGMEKRKLIRVV